MKRLVLPALLAVLFAASAPGLFAADAKEEVEKLVEKIKGKLQTGSKTQASLAPELAEFDALLAEHKSEKTDDVANIVLMKAMLCLEVFNDQDKASALLRQVETDYPGTHSATEANKVLEAIANQSEAEKIRASLKEGTLFPPIDEIDVDGKPFSTAAHKGKILLVEFWATWCSPCVEELPYLQKAYQQYHDRGFDIIAISLNEDRETLVSFLKEKQIPWQQYCDGKGWESKLPTRYGLHGLPASFLLDRDGKIIASDLREEGLEGELAKALK